MKNDYDEVLLTEEQAASILQLSPKTLQQKRSARKPPVFVKLSGGSAVRYRWEDIADYIAQSRVAVKEDAHA